MRTLVFKAALITLFFLTNLSLSETYVGGIICTDTTWDLAGSPYIVTGGGGIVIGCGATLTIEADVEVKFEPELAIVVGSASFGEGCLVARGTAESPIIFTSVKDPCNLLDPAAPGDWSRIHFTDYSVDATYDADNYISGCILEHVIVEYAGYGDYGAIFAEKSSPYLNYCEVRHNSYYGIHVNGTDAPHINIVNCEVWDHPKVGIYIASGSNHTLLENEIHDNKEGGIYLSSAGNNTIIRNKIQSNGQTGIFGYYSASNTLIENIIANCSGGGLFFSYGSPSQTIIGNTISGNVAVSGGGIVFARGNYGNTLKRNIINANTANNGGGIYFSGTCHSNTLSENEIIDNVAHNSGGGIFWENDSYYGGTYNFLLLSNTIMNNKADGEGGAIYLDGGHDHIFYSNVIVGNETNTGTTGGVFVTNNAERMSLAGDPCEGTYNIIWGNDGYCIYNDNTFNADGRNDIDARYVQWGTCNAQDIMDCTFDYFDDSSKAFVVFYPFVCPGDFDMDRDVNWLDLRTFCDNWLRADCAIPDWCAGTDLNLSTNVNFFDYAYFANNWLEGV